LRTTVEPFYALQNNIIVVLCKIITIYCLHFCCRSIYLLNGETLELKHVVHGHDQSVECIIWHPTHVTCDYSEESKYKNYFASSSHCIRVHQLNEGIVYSILTYNYKNIFIQLIYLFFRW